MHQPRPPRRRALLSTGRVAAVVSLLAWLWPSFTDRRQNPAAPMVPAGPTSWVVDMRGDGVLSGAVVPVQPFPGQLRTRKDGTCPRRKQVPINGGCWRRLDDRPEPPPERCGEDYEYDGRCYTPVAESQRLPTSIGR